MAVKAWSHNSKARHLPMSGGCMIGFWSYWICWICHDNRSFSLVPSWLAHVWIVPDCNESCWDLLSARLADICSIPTNPSHSQAWTSRQACYPCYRAWLYERCRGCDGRASREATRYNHWVDCRDLHWWPRMGWDEMADVPIDVSCSLQHERWNIWVCLKMLG